MRRSNLRALPVSRRLAGVLLAVFVVSLTAPLAHDSPTLAVGTDPIDTTVVSLPVAAQVAGVAVGAGAVWVANGRPGTVSRIDSRTAEVVATIAVAEPSPACGRCWGAVAARGNAVWATMNSAGPVVARIDPNIDRVAATIPVGVLPFALAVDKEEALWLTTYENAVVRVDGRDGGRLARIPVRSPWAIAVGQDAIWVTVRELGSAGEVVRIDPRTERVVANIRVGREPGALAVGDAGVWVANEADHTISRIEPHTNTVAATIPVVHVPVGIVIGNDAVWVASRGFSVLSVPSVSRIDPGTNSVVETTPIDGTAPVGMVGGEASLWVASRNPDEVVRLGPVSVPASAPVAGGPPLASVVLGAATVLLLAAGLLRRRSSRRADDRPVPDGHLLRALVEATRSESCPNRWSSSSTTAGITGGHCRHRIASDLPRMSGKALIGGDVGCLRREI